MQYLLDTTWLAEYLRGTPKSVQAIREYRPSGLGMSIVSLAELFSGVERSTDRAKAERIARTWGELDAKLTLAGQKIGDADLFIAATALTYELTLCSQDRRHFGRVAGLKIASL